MTRGVRRILFVHYTTPQILGGVEQVMAAHAAALMAAGKEVAVLAGRGGAKPRGVRVIRVAEADSRHPAVERDLAALSDGVRAPAHDALVARLMKKVRPHVERADRVVVHNVMTMPLNLALTEVLATLAREHPDRFIAWTHDISFFDGRYAAMRRDGAPWDLVKRRIPGVRYVTVSEQRAEQLAALTGIKRHEIEVVTNGIDVAEVLGLAPTGLRLAQRLHLFDADRCSSSGALRGASASRRRSTQRPSSPPRPRRHARCDRYRRAPRRDEQGVSRGAVEAREAR